MSGRVDERPALGKTLARQPLSDPERRSENETPWRGRLKGSRKQPIPMPMPTDAPCIVLRIVVYGSIRVRSSPDIERAGPDDDGCSLPSPEGETFRIASDRLSRLGSRLGPTSVTRDGKRFRVGHVFPRSDMDPRGSEISHESQISFESEEDEPTTWKSRSLRSSI